MAKPTITTRAGKGAALTYDELDDNFSNIKDATVTLTGGSTAVTTDLNGNITLVAGTNVTITGNNSAKTITISATSGGGGGTMSGFTVSGDTGSTQSITDANNLSILGGTGLSSVASATDTVTINLDNTSVTAGNYIYASFTVDAQGRITAAGSNTYVSIPIGNGTTDAVLNKHYESSNIVTGVSGTWALDNFYQQRQLSLVGNVTFTATSGSDFPVGATVVTTIWQDATGNRTATWDSNILFEGGANPALSTAGNSKDLLIVRNVRGTFYATLQKGFA